MALSHPYFLSRWDALRSCYFPRRLFDQDFGLPPLSEEPLKDWMQWVENRLSLSPSDSTTPSPCPSPLQRPLFGGMSLIQQTSGNWKISLDVKHFTPEELQVKIQEGYLEISGNHKEKQDQHGFISRSFTRKYMLPSEVDTLSVTSSLTSDGILIVEAPLPNPAVQVPVEVTAPVNTEDKSAAEREVETEKVIEEETDQGKELEEDTELLEEQGKDTAQEVEPDKEEAEQEKVVLQE
ncbi:heat shock protein beta-1 [Chiloscyllium plagiosum]|uniref:heat shock protein beta-1 n=1 Tax=Chiloscyllium plagiosum TaxID=36176 RepID=UPI001CB85373|nr:heat shock protein beta-1 [Chiloscyllium plagiosum]